MNRSMPGLPAHHHLPGFTHFSSSHVWMWVWVNSGRWWWAGRPGPLRFMGSQRVRHDWATELNWTDQLVSSLARRVCCRQALWLWSWEPQHGSPRPQIYWSSELGLQASAAQPKAEKRDKWARGKPWGFNHNVLLLLLLSCFSCLTLWDPRDGSHQAPTSLGFSRQEHWSGCFPTDGQ